MKIAILGTRGIPNNYGGFEQCAEYLSVGLVKKGHEVSIYSPHFHPYNKDEYKGVKIKKKYSPQYFLGNSAANFIYDYLCLKDAVKSNFDIILELGLITSSLSLIFCRHRGKLIATNLDGLEWKRSKWNKIVQVITKSLEQYGVKFSDYLIADNLAIQEYIKREYKRESKFIAYGTHKINPPNNKCLKHYGIYNKEYLLTIARLEPENNIELMLDAFIESKAEYYYVIIGNHLTNYGDFLKDKYRNPKIIFLGGIFNKQDLDNIRYFSRLYLHGHSVGGTNPALLEAMAASTLIISHNNKFNKSVVEENAFFFKNKNELVRLLLDNNLFSHKNKFVKNNLKKIKQIYNWDFVIDQYESYFQEILRLNLNSK